MLGDFTCRVALQLFGYLWPGYQCFKALQSDNRQQLHHWCTYWVIMAAFTAAQPLADTFLWWVPLYYEAKLAFACYLWYNDLAGARHVYGTYLQPFITQNEPRVDKQLSEGRAAAVVWASSNASRVVQLVQTRALMVLSQLQVQPPETAAEPAVPEQKQAAAAAAPGRRPSFTLESFYSARSAELRAYPVVQQAGGKDE